MLYFLALTDAADAVGTVRGMRPVSLPKARVMSLIAPSLPTVAVMRAPDESRDSCSLKFSQRSSNFTD